MKILDIKVEDALQFPFKKDNWLNTFGIYVLITFLTSISIGILVFFFLFAGLILLEVNLDISAGSLMLFLISALPCVLIFTLIQMYLQGYILEVVGNIKNKEKEAIPRHGEIWRKIKLGFAQLILLLGPMSISLIFLLLSITIIVAGVTILESNLLLAIVLMIFGLLAIITASLTLLTTSVLIFPSMLYIYLEKRSIANAYCFKNIKVVLKNSWKEFLLLYAISIIVFFAISIIGQIPLLGNLVFLFAIPYITFVIAFVTGNIFKDIDKLKLFN